MSACGAVVVTGRVPEGDALFAKSRVLMPGPERTALYEKLRAMIIEDQPMIGSMARTRYYVWHDRVRNVHPEEVYLTWMKYVDVGPEKSPSPATTAAKK